MQEKKKKEKKEGGGINKKAENNHFSWSVLPQNDLSELGGSVPGGGDGWGAADDMGTVGA